MPSTWAARAKRATTCQATQVEGYDCLSQPDIAEGEIIVRIKPREGPTVNFHPECWVETVVDILRKEPYEENKKGRKSLEISEEETIERRKIMARHSSLGARIKNFNQRLLDGEDNPELALRIERLKLLQDKLWWEIQAVGGAPGNWATPPGGEEYTRQQRMKGADSGQQNGGVPEEQDVAV